MILIILQTVAPFLAIGFLLLIMGLVIVFSSKNPSNWPSVEGRIVKSDLNFQTEAAESTEILKCEPKVNYTFEINGKSFTSENITLNKSNIDRVQAQEIIDSYPNDKAVEVYYNPNNPEEAYLVPKKNTIGISLILCGFTILAVTIAYLISKIV